MIELKTLAPEKVLLSARSVDEAAVDGVEVAITVPLAFTARKEPAGVARLVIANDEVVALVVVDLVVMVSVRPLRVVRLFKVDVPARAVSKRACVQKRLPDSVKLAVVPKRLVKTPVVAKRLVVVAEVVVLRVVMRSVNPRRVVRLVRVVVAASAASKRAWV